MAITKQDKHRKKGKDGRSNKVKKVRSRKVRGAT